MDKDEEFFCKHTESLWGNPEEDWNPTLSEEIDWSTVIRGEPMDEPAGFNLEQALLGEQHNKTVQSWIEKYEIKRVVDGGSGKVYVRDQNGYFKVDTESDLSTVLEEFL